ncbi:hypothetical protein [Planctomonas psychrotolerans]|uniref:hypothetical protein n=1 Tax=Planctomonas psychrotolerans TaxID=2528712 RepID=UPI0012388560|nr:hypothetical protein [Planctomonas psychrotolerans]
MTNSPAGGSRSIRILALLNTIGDVLLLQLCFFVASLGVVTVPPAAMALQTSLDDVLFRDESAGIRVFFTRFAAAAGRHWRLALLVPVLTVGFVVGILFWSADRSPLGFVALALLVPLAGLFAGLYLTGLASLVGPRVDRSSRELVLAAWLRLREQPLHAAGCVVVLVTWFLLLLQVPTLVLVGSGVAPAMLAFWLRRGVRRPNP